MNTTRRWFRVQGCGLWAVAPSPEPRASSEFRRGQTLIVVLWVMGLVSIAIGALSVRSTHELRLGRVPLHILQRRAIAQAGLQQAIRVVQQDARDAPALDTLQEPWATGYAQDHAALFDRIAVGDGTFSVGHRDADTLVPGLADEERKLPLNLAAPAQIQRLIELVQPGSVDAAALANAIIDWRDEPVGAVCGPANPPCHNLPFDSVDELRLVPGMTPQVFAALEPYVTVYGYGTVNVNTASAKVLNALGLECQGEHLVQQRAQEPFSTPPASCPGSGVTSSAFTVSVDAELTTASGHAQLRAVIDRDGRILFWSPQ